VGSVLLAPITPGKPTVFPILPPRGNIFPRPPLVNGVKRKRSKKIVLERTTF